MAIGSRQIQIKLAFILICVVLIVTSAAFWALYSVVLSQSKIQLEELAKSQARLIESVAKFNAIHSSEGVSRAATISQIRESHYRYQGFGRTGEILLGQLRDEMIYFILPDPDQNFEVPKPLHLDEHRNTPMAQALLKGSGVIQAPDLDDVEVLAAYEYLPFFEAGLVVKVDLEDIRYPFFNAALISSVFAIISLIVGTLLYSRLTEPLIREVFIANDQLKQREAKLENLSKQLARYLSPPIYQSMFEGANEARIYTRRKKLTVFFSDIVGFTSRTDSMEPEDLSYQLNSYLDQMARVVSDHGGTLDKFVGDAVLVFFGDPESRGVKEDAVACLQMAWAMRSVIDDLCGEWQARGLGGDFQVRMGITTGYCTVGNFGSDSRMEYTTIGNHVNLASRLESSARPGEILISKETHSLISSHFDCVERDPVDAKGFKEPVQVYEVSAPRETILARNVLDIAGDGYSVHLDPDTVPIGERSELERKLRSVIASMRRNSD